ncbi:MAG: LysM peptidoglycan-binding domain-containing protein [candidate division KSB1 bacterium]|nr:LysM peptidoglycan-binding domain-containing protein [candidate division KSB1 bacterium]
MRSMTKVFLGLFFLNSIVGGLKKDGIITGEISINVPKLIKNLSTGGGFIKIVSSDEQGNLDDNYFYDNEERNYHNTHVVRRGETLVNLEKLYGVPWQAIKQINGIRDVRKVRVGQRLIIPMSDTPHLTLEHFGL